MARWRSLRREAPLIYENLSCACVHSPPSSLEFQMLQGRLLRSSAPMLHLRPQLALDHRPHGRSTATQSIVAPSACLSRSRELHHLRYVLQQQLLRRRRLLPPLGPSRPRAVRSGGRTWRFCSTSGSSLLSSQVRSCLRGHPNAMAHCSSGIWSLISLTAWCAPVRTRL